MGACPDGTDGCDSKELLKAFFADFLRLFHPRKAAKLDLLRVTFLDKEPFTDLAGGQERGLDLVAKVRMPSGKPEAILVHVEVGCVVLRTATHPASTATSSKAGAPSASTARVSS